MNRRASYLLAVVTVVAAFGIGALMEYLDANRAVDLRSAAPSVTAIEPVVSTPLATSDSADTGFLPPQSDTCTTDLSARRVPGALVDLSVTAACWPNARVKISHAGMVFADMTDSDGRLSLVLPALSESALLVASFADGGGGAVRISVPDVALYHRTVLQWGGPDVLQLHASDFDAFTPRAGQTSRDASGDGSDASQGFVTRLGNAGAPNPRYAHVYSFPVALADQGGAINLSVLAKVTPQTCETTIRAQTKVVERGKPQGPQELDLQLPDCDGTVRSVRLDATIPDLTLDVPDRH